LQLYLMTYSIGNLDRPHALRGADGKRTCLSPHGALRAYTVFLTAEPRRGSSLVLSSSVTVSGDALRAYPELLTAESLHFPLRCCLFTHSTIDFK
ncbi:MAG: hypothetical protein MR030_07295, partial [Bacteroidales bacterium]|nr:hypothetical protein [Bacteroidales bacterium]